MCVWISFFQNLQIIFTRISRSFTVIWTVIQNKMKITFSLRKRVTYIISHYKLQTFSKLYHFYHLHTELQCCPHNVQKLVLTWCLGAIFTDSIAQENHCGLVDHRDWGDTLELLLSGHGSICFYKDSRNMRGLLWQRSPSPPLPRGLYTLLNNAEYIFSATNSANVKCLPWWLLSG